MSSFVLLQSGRRGFVNVQSPCKLFPCHAMKQSIASDFLTQGLGGKEVLRYVPKEVDDLREVPYSRLAGCKEILPEHIGEGIQYRTLDRRLCLES